MKNPSNISHPLKNRTGTSQRTRIIAALESNSAPIDGKTLADQLHLISEYGRQVNFYQYVKNEIEGEYQDLSDWASFFKDSLPFQFAALSKVSIDTMEQQFLQLSQQLKANPSQQSLEAILGFIFNQLIAPTTFLYKTVDKVENSFGVTLLAILKSSFHEPLKSYISLYNASVTFLCVCKRNFTDFMKEPWQLKVNDIYAIDVCIKKVKKGKKEAFLKADETLNAIFYQMLSGMQSIVEVSPDYIQESLMPLEASFQKKHQPHLGLLFTFLELFKHFQGNINELGKKHLDFFYQQVLKIIPKEAVPDKAHIVFEVAKHLDEYPLPKDLLLKDGKDANKQDIEFGLDHEIILDKAQIEDLRTLSLYQKGSNSENHLEGVYIAPLANSVDGKGEKFKKDASNNWSTLGSKFSKFVAEGNTIFEEHPPARLGFVLASPVLLLQEGTRTIIIKLNCQLPEDSGPTAASEIQTKLNSLSSQKVYFLDDAIVAACGSKLNKEGQQYLQTLLLEKNPYPIDDLQEFLGRKVPISCLPIFSEEDAKSLCGCIEGKGKSSPNRLFNIVFSGEEEWVVPKTEKIEELGINVVSLEASETEDEIQFVIEVELEDDDPMVVFFDEEKLGEKIELENPFPLVKIELNPDAKIIENAFDCERLDENGGNETNIEEKCCLKNRKPPNSEIHISPYDCLKGLTLVDARIDVKVCGVKNLIVQNDENLQDVNKPIMPFGPRPKVGSRDKDTGDWFIDGGASFYIGSKEIFCKNWQRFWITTTWKDKPQDLKDYYRFYTDVEFEDGSDEITDESFRFAASILDDGVWKKDIITTPGIDLNHPELLELFTSHNTEDNTCLEPKDLATYCHGIERKLPPPPLDPENLYIPKSMPFEELEPLTVNSRKGFAKLTLAGVAFQHEKYTYVLAQQMMELAEMANPIRIAQALEILNETKPLATQAKNLLGKIVLLLASARLTVDTTLRNKIGIHISGLATSISIDVNEAIRLLNLTNPNVSGALTQLTAANLTINHLISDLGTLSSTTSSSEINVIVSLLDEIKSHIDDTASVAGLETLLNTIDANLTALCLLLKPTELGLPNEPYTPLIKSLCIDYEAIAEKDDLEIVHLYPYENTSKGEDIEQNPTLFPYFDAQGTLFIGIENMTPGGNLSLLFQLAEATANSESNRAEIKWHYLSNNQWIPLRTDFNVISDETDGLTVSGIVSIVVPDAINKIGNTVMPDTLHWIKVSAPANVEAVAETIGIHTQAARASARFGAQSDQNRLETALESGSIAKLVEGDFSVKKVEQPYEGFDGRKPETEGHFYTRVSEHLKHKGRGIMLNDYEKIVLEKFPTIFKAKCISHTMGLSANDYRRDLEIAPGFVVVAVIPDLTKLKSGSQLRPKAPISLLEKIGDHLRERTSPFARLKIMNPRYECIDLTISVRLYRGKSESFYAQKLKADMTSFLAPWFLGDSEKLTFGQVVLFSDIVGFIELLDYIDFIVNLEMKGEDGQTGSVIKPLTARSILTGGEICVTIDKEECI